MLAHFNFITTQVHFQLVLIDALAYVKKWLPGELSQNLVLQLEKDVLTGGQALVSLWLHRLA